MEHFISKRKRGVCLSPYPRGYVSVDKFRFYLECKLQFMLNRLNFTWCINSSLHPVWGRFIIRVSPYMYQTFGGLNCVLIVRYAKPFIKIVIFSEAYSRLWTCQQSVIITWQMTQYVLYFWANCSLTYSKHYLSFV